MKGKKRVHAFKNRMEHWQVVSIGLTVYDAIAMILAFFLALWFRFDCRYTMIPKEYLNFYFKFILIYAVISIVSIIASGDLQATASCLGRLWQPELHL